MDRSILHLWSKQQDNQCVWPITVSPLIECSGLCLTVSWQKNSKNLSFECNLCQHARCVCVCVCVCCLLFLYVIRLCRIQQNLKEPNWSVSSVLGVCSADVLFRDEFSSLHCAIVIYIGSAWTNEGFFLFFFLLNAKTKTEGGESYLQFGASIKMQIVGNHFSAVTMEALSLQRRKTARRIGPSPDPQPRILYLQTEAQRRGQTSFFFCRLVRFALCVSLRKSSCWTDLMLTVSLLTWGAVQGLSINQDKVSLRGKPWGTGVLKLTAGTSYWQKDINLNQKELL